MPKGAKQKYKLYRVAQIMMEHTDEEHFITMPQLIGELEKYGITADRKSLYADLRKIPLKPLSNSQFSKMTKWRVADIMYQPRTL